MQCYKQHINAVIKQFNSNAQNGLDENTIQSVRKKLGLKRFEGWQCKKYLSNPVRAVYQSAYSHFNRCFAGIFLPATTKGWPHTFDYYNEEWFDWFLPGVEIRKYPGIN